MNWFYSLPRTFIVGFSICAGVALIILSSPPQDLCDHQVNSYRKENVHFIFRDSSRKIKIKTFYEKEIEQCQQTNSAGGCYTLFHSVNRLIQSFKKVQLECHQKLSQIKEVRNVVKDIYSLLVEISWEEGSQNPIGWLSQNDVRLYCQLKNQIRYFYGFDYLNQLDSSIYEDKTRDVSFDQFKDRSLLSQYCAI